MSFSLESLGGRRRQSSVSQFVNHLSGTNSQFKSDRIRSRAGPFVPLWESLPSPICRKGCPAPAKIKSFSKMRNFSLYCVHFGIMIGGSEFTQIWEILPTRDWERGPAQARPLCYRMLLVVLSCNCQRLVGGLISLAECPLVSSRARPLFGYKAGGQYKSRQSRGWESLF